MSWVTIIWSMIASACLTLAAVNLLVWLKQRTAWANLFFSAAAVAAAGMAFCELLMMQAATPTQFSTALRWYNLPVFLIVTSLVGFVIFYMKAGRPWLAWTVCSLRAVALVIGPLTGENLNFRAVTGLRHVPFLGEPVAVGVGVANPWMLVGQLSLVLFLVFVADATFTVCRRGGQRRLLVTGGSIVFLVLAGLCQSLLVMWQVVHMPLVPSLSFLAIVATMAYEMSREALNAAQLTGELRESQQQMALATEAANLGVWVRDLARNEIWASANWRTLFGFAPAERLDFEKFLQRLYPDDREAVRRILLRTVESSDHYETEFRVLLPDGQVRWIASRGRAEFNAGGKPVRVRGVSSDISERKRTEEASRNAHELMAAVFNSVPGLLYLYAADGQIVQWNKKHEELTGFTSEELLNRRAGDWYDAEERVKFERGIGTVFSQGYAEAELNLTHKNGEKVPYFLTGSKVIINGKPHLVGIGINISERKKAEALLRESEARMSLAAEAAGFGVWMWSFKDDHVWGSERWLRMFGLAPDAATSLQMVMQRIHPEDRERVEREVRRAVADQSDYAGEYRVLLPDGTQRWLVARGRTHSEPPGKPDRMMGAAMDITERKQSEADALRQREELAHLSRVTTLSELSGSLAHELNQPLAIILTNAQAAQRLLRQSPPDLAEALDILDDIVLEDERAGEVIRRLRSLLKRGETSLQSLAINEVVEEVLQLTRSDLIGRGIKLQREFAQNLPQVMGDRIQLQQVLLNLILNACDAMADNPLSDRHLMVIIAHRDDVVRVSVSDNGSGLPPDPEKVFESFYTTKKHGLGLGLAICRSLITAHQGKLWAEAKVAAGLPQSVPTTGHGATFHFELAAVKESKP